MARRGKLGRISGRRPGVEGLESRHLLAVTVQSFPLGLPSTQATGITSGPGGLLWFTETNASPPTGAIGSIDPATQTIATFPIPNVGSDPQAIVPGPDGDLWFADFGTDSIGQFNPTTHAVVEFPTPTTASGPSGITVGPDGNLWFTEIKTGMVGEINPTTHAIVEFPLGSSAVKPGAITVGPDGDLWFTETGPNALGRIDPTTHAIAAFPIPAGDGTVVGVSIVVGPDQNLFFATSTTSSAGTSFGLVQMNPITHNVLSDPAVAVGIATDPNGKVYTTGGPVQAISEYNLTKRVSEPTAIPGAPSGAVALGIAVGPDGKLWFADTGLIGAASILPANQDIVSGTVLIPGTSGNSPAVGRTVFVDLKGDATLDPGDPTAVTHGSGNYVFGNVPPGTFTIRVVPFPGDVASTATVVLEGSQIVTASTILIQPTGAILPLTFTTTPLGTTNPDVPTAEVTALYEIVLGRAPDAAGLAGWVGAIRHEVPFAQVVFAFLHSTAYDDRVIASDYQGFLGRAASQSEIDAWAGLMQGGLTAEQLASLMLTSPEFNALHPTNSSFVQTLYGDLLGRQATSAEVTAWDSFLAAGASRGTVANLFIHSEAADQRAVDGLYPIVLGKAADPTGEAFFIGALENSVTLAEVTQDFLTSNAFFNRVLATVF